jgi:hypothetical protein
MNISTRNIAITEVVAEFHNAAGKHPRFNSAHEGFAVILEEVDELKAEVWKRTRDREAMRKEAVQVAAMALRFLVDLCVEEPAVTGTDVYRLDHHGDLSYYMLGHVDKDHFRKTVTGTWWNDLLFHGLAEAEHVSMIRRNGHEHLIVPAGTLGSFTATWAQREEL